MKEEKAQRLALTPTRSQGETIAKKAEPGGAGTSAARRAAQVGIGLIVLASLLWSLNGALIKIVTNQGRGAGGVSIAFYRSLFAGLFLLPVTLGKWRSSAVNGTSILKRPAALWCVVFFTLMTLSFVVANTITQAASVIILQYTSTFWIFGLSPLILKERPRSSDFWILALAMVGIGIIFFGETLWSFANRAVTQSTSTGSTQGGSPSPSLTGLAIALASGLFYALLTLMIRRLRNADSAAVTVMNNLGSAVLLFPVAVAVGGLTISVRSFWLLLFMGIVQFGLPYYLYTLGLKRIPAYQAALITLLEPVLVPIWAVLAIGRSEMPPAWTMIGGGVILVALLLFLNAARRTQLVDSSLRSE
jgi:drug/metabolite transporter, DME family